MNFEWQTEDDNWGAPPPSTPEPPPADRSHWRWVGLAAFILLLLTTSGWYLFRQANNRVAEVEALLEEEVLASHRLVRQAAAEADYEIFVQVLSGRDPEWVAGRRELLIGGQFFDRRGLGLAHLQPTAEPQVNELIFSPDLTTATMATNEIYAIDVGNGLSDTVVLAHNAVYRQGPDSWLYSPPLEDEWGAWMTQEGRYLTLIFPEAEAEIARRLAVDLETKLAAFCAGAAGFSCPADFHRVVRLSKDPVSLLLRTDMQSLSDISATGELMLPAPRLVGRPVDEDGYRALLRGYAYYVVGGALLQFVDYDCCDQEPFMQAVVDQVLADLAVRPRPLHRDAYRELYQAGMEIDDPYISWNSRVVQPAGAAQHEAAAVIGFVRHVAPETSLYQMAQGIDQSFSYWDWLRRLTPGLTNDQEIRRAWLDFLIQRSAVNAQTRPYALPDQDVLALCGLSNRRINGALYRYGVADGSWQAVAPELAFTNLLPVPGSDTAMLVFADNRVLTEPEVALYSWVADAPVRRWQPASDTEMLYLYSGPDVSGRYMLVSLRSIGGGESGLHAFDLAACASGTCQSQIFDGTPVFAPDGEHVLVLLPTAPTGPEPAIYLAATGGERLADLGPGRSPFWIDAQTFGWVRAGADEQDEIVVSRVGGEDVETLAGLPDLLAVIPPEHLLAAEETNGPAGSSPAIDGVVANPARPDQLFVTVDAGHEQGDQILLLERASGRISWRLAAGIVGFQGQPILGFSPDGAWLTVEQFDPQAHKGSVILHQIATGREEIFPLQGLPYGLSWTADSRWLVKADGDWLVLIAPGMGYQQVTIHDPPTCGPVGWAGR
jgi:hypothetical protein